jgi:hypothetical protein
LKVHFPGSVYQAEEHARWKAFQSKLNRDLRSQLVYR